MATDKKISQLGAAGSLADTDLFVLANSGNNKVTGATVKASVAPIGADYLVETAQAGLTGEVVTGTTYMTSSAYAARQAAAKAGRLFLPSDGFYLERDSGSAWAPWGPIFPMTPPVNGDFAWANQGGASVDTTYGGVYLLSPASAGNNMRVRQKAVPSLPYTITAAFLADHMTVQFPSAGIGWSDGTKYAVIRTTPDTAAVPYLFICSSKWSTTTAFSANYTQVGRHLFGSIVWFRITEDNTNRTTYFSMDGQHWTQIHQVGRTDFLTATQVLFFVESNNATWPAGMLLLHWKQT